ncbi:hypothetical protein GGR57DRAFT_448118 [Xylariaceae sp. FL1272]|nr:hypothetical protein GGR57DRAFT_448118 [Xylariaceae sp. FL1272]
MCENSRKLCKVVKRIFNSHLCSGNAAVSISCLLFAIPLPPRTSYFAFGLPAFILSVIGADITWPCLTLFTSRSLDRDDQALGGGLINAMAQVGRAIGLAIATAIQTSVMARDKGVSVEESGSIMHDSASLHGLKAAFWFSSALGISCFVLVIVAFRGTGIVGHSAKTKKESGV